MPPTNAAPTPPAAASAAAVDRPKRNPKTAMVDSTTMVKVYNRSPATYTWGKREKVTDEESGKEIEKVTETVIIAPGRSGIVPENVADIWRRSSGGLVLPEEEANAAAAAAATALDKEKARSTELQDKLQAAEARQAELEAQLAQATTRKNGGRKADADAPAAEAG